jgi:hypothetical protein
MTIANPPKALILLVFLGSLAACADRERLNCPRTKNQVMTRTTTDVPTTTTSTIDPGGRCV